MVAPIATVNARAGFLEVYKDNPSGTAFYVTDRYKELVLNFTTDQTMELALVLAERVGRRLAPKDDVKDGRPTLWELIETYVGANARYYFVRQTVMDMDVVSEYEQRMIDALKAVQARLMELDI